MGTDRAVRSTLTLSLGCVGVRCRNNQRLQHLSDGSIVGINQGDANTTVVDLVRCTFLCFPLDSPQRWLTLPYASLLNASLAADRQGQEGGDCQGCG